MPSAILGRKVGMTRVYDEQDRNVPVTVIQAGPCQVSQVKTAATDGYDAVQLAYEDVKGRASTFANIGHDGKAGLTPKRSHHEVRLDEGQAEGYDLGQTLGVDQFAEVRFVDVVGTSKGHGFTGTMKRHNFQGMPGSHGTKRKDRSPGAISGRASRLGVGKLKKGIRMAGHMGDERVTVRSLALVSIDQEDNLLLIKGPVPGPKKGLVLVRQAVRLKKSKARAAAS